MPNRESSNVWGKGIVLRAFAVALVGLVSVGACNDVSSSPEHDETAASALHESRHEPGAPKAPLVLSFDLTYPAATDEQSATVGAGTELVLAEDAKVLDANGRPGTLTNAGLDERGQCDPHEREDRKYQESREHGLGHEDARGLTFLGPHTSSGAVVSIPSVEVAPGASAVRITSSGRVRATPSGHPGLVVEHAKLVPPVLRSVIAHASGDEPTDVQLRPRSSSTLAPGHYRDVIVGPGATLDVSSGTYIVERFVLAKDAQLQVRATSGTVELYIRTHVNWEGSVAGSTDELVVAYLGRGELDLGHGFRGVALAPFGALVLTAHHSSDVYEGTFYGKRVFVGPNVTVRKLAAPVFGADLEGCVSLVQVRTNLPENERGIAYQEDVMRLCSAPGLSVCKARLIARANVDYTAAAARVVSGQFSPAQYLALSRDRTRKLRTAEEDTVVAMQRCTSPDSDGDGVIDRLDACADTPDLAATDDHGCPLSSLPAAPAADDVARVIAGANLLVNPKCGLSVVPERVPAGGFYWRPYPERGTYILAGSVTNQAPGCAVWYEFEIQETTGPHAGDSYLVAFMDREAKSDLVDLGRPVPPGLIQFNPRPGDVGTRNRLAIVRGTVGVRYRVRVMNANGIRSAWSDYKVSDRSSCTALGFECGE